MYERAQQAAAPAPAPPSDAQRALLDRYCVTCHNARLEDRRPGARQGHDRRRAPAEHAEVWEKVVRKLHGAHDAAAGHAAARRSRRSTRSPRGSRRRSTAPRCGRPEPGPLAAASAEPHRVRQRDPRPARARHRRDGAPAGRRRERTGSTTSPTCCACRRRCSSSTWRPSRKISAPRGRRPGHDAGRHGVPRAAGSRAGAITSKACRSARAAACSSATTSRSTRLRVQRRPAAEHRRLRAGPRVAAPARDQHRRRARVRGAGRRRGRQQDVGREPRADEGHDRRAAADARARSRPGRTRSA